MIHLVKKVQNQTVVNQQLTTDSSLGYPELDCKNRKENRRFFTSPCMELVGSLRFFENTVLKSH